MSKTGFCITVIVLACAAATARGQLNLGSDGSDGAFVFTPDANNPNLMTVNLGLAVNGPWDLPSPMPGRGVYDATKWAIVFKYTNVTVPAGRTIVFRNHPTTAPVVWLANGSIDISGTVRLDGANGANWDGSTGSTEPGPGGFHGGRNGGINNIGNAAGMGPGGAPHPTVLISRNVAYGTGGSYGTPGTPALSANAVGPTYGFVTLLPLIGGSGGSAARIVAPGTDLAGAGGGGGGAMLLGANNTISLRSTSRLSANGGNGGEGSYFRTPYGGGGSGGAIRILANQFNMDPGAIVVAEGGAGVAYNMGNGGLGRTRMESNTFSISGDAQPPFSSGPVGTVFPIGTQPLLRVTSINSGTPNLPSNPSGGLFHPFIDGMLSTSEVVVVRIDASNVPVTPTPAVVSMRVTNRAGALMSVAAELQPGGNNVSSVWLASIPFSVGVSSVIAVADLQ